MRIIEKGWLVCAIIALLFSACKEPDGIGLDVLPDGEQMPIAWVDTFTIQARTVKYDSVQSSGLSSYLIGDFQDPIFGRVTSQLYTQFKLPTVPVDFGSNATLDSVILNLVYAGSYGSTDKIKGIMKWGVFEMAQDLYPTGTGDSIYYSNITHPTVSTPIAEFEFRPDLYSSVPNGLDTIPLPPCLRVRLSSEFGDALLASGNLASNEAFVEEFEGLNIRSTATTMSDGHGSILNFNVSSDNSRLELYYHNDDEDSLNFVFDIKNNYGVHTNFAHEFPAEIETAIADSTVAGAQRLYIQSMAGLRIKIELPHLKSLNELGAIAINKAELIIPIDETILTDFTYPTGLQVVGINEEGGSVFLPDFFEGSEYYGGAYDAEVGGYVFNIARHLQSILNAPEEPDYGLYIVNSSNAVNARRAVFNGPEHPTEAMKLRMTYSIIE